MEEKHPILGLYWTARDFNELTLYRMWHDNVLTDDGNYDVECTVPDIETAKAYVEARHIRECWYGGMPYLLDRSHTSEEAHQYALKEEQFKNMHLDMRDITFVDANGKMGLKDVCGNILIEPTFDDIPERYSCFERSRLIPVVLVGKYYLYDVKDMKVVTRGYDYMFRYFGTYVEYFVAEENGKKGLLDGYDGHELTPVNLDEIYQTRDPDSCIPVEKDKKVGFLWGDIYAEPIYEKVNYSSEEYLKVWLNGKRGWIDSRGRFTTKESEASFGSWYDLSK
jgi:hypothetical protein